MTNINLCIRRDISLTLSLFALFTFLSTKPAFSQTSVKTSAERKLVTRVAPEYPDILRRNYIGGQVRLEVTVSPSGTVEDVHLLGGSAALAQNAMNAIKHWKYAPAATKDELVVMVVFDPRAN
jgi:TonB family protein